MRTVPALTLDGLASAPWALDRAVLAELVTYVQNGEPIKAATRPPEPRRNSGAVAVIPIHGVIEHRSSFLLELFGGTSVEDIRGMLRQAAADPQFSAIVLDIDSPGGGVAGVTELAQEIRAARGAKRIVAVANTTAASAAYWLASQANHVLVTPSGQVGSIGVYAIHVDVSRALDAEGVKVTIISAGDRKTDGNEFEPLSDDARTEMQKRVDAFDAQFVGDVAKGRGVPESKVRSDYGQGVVLLAKDALASGLVDGIGTLDDALRLANRPAAPARAEGEELDLTEVDLPFHAQLDQASEQMAYLVEHAKVRMGLRAKENVIREAEGRPNRPLLSDHKITALRSIRDAISALLTADEPPPEPAPAAAVEPPAPVAPVLPVAPVQAKRFRSSADWAAYLQEITH